MPVGSSEELLLRYTENLVKDVQRKDIALRKKNKLLKQFRKENRELQRRLAVYRSKILWLEQTRTSREII